AVKAAGEADIYPDFPAIAAGYRVRAERVSAPAELAAAFERMLADPDEPYLLDVIVAAEENVYPMIPAGGTYRDIIMGPGDMPAAAREQQGSNV
ncbi:MAG: acetolactate synthase, large subunit, biosynthetic type, partial [Haliea sp.]